MKKLFYAFSGTALLSMSAMAASWTGTISDSHCGATHAEASDAATACVKKCVKEGSDPVFVSDGKVYKLSDASKAKVAAHYGHKVTLSGDMDGDTINVTSVKMEKKG